MDHNMKGKMKLHVGMETKVGMTQYFLQIAIPYIFTYSLTYMHAGSPVYSV